MSEKGDKHQPNQKSEKDFFLTSDNDLRERAEASMKSVESVNTRRLEEFAKEIIEWKAKRLK